MTKDELAYMRDLKKLDDIRLGMRAPSVRCRHPLNTLERCRLQGWLRWEADRGAYGGFATLTTKGLRALQRASRE